MFIRWLQCYSCISVQSRSLIYFYPLCPTSSFIQPMFYVLRLPSYNLCAMSYVYLHTTYVLCPTYSFIQPMFYVLRLPSYKIQRLVLQDEGGLTPEEIRFLQENKERLLELLELNPNLLSDDMMANIVS